MRDRETGVYVGVPEATVQEDRTALIAYTVFVPYQRTGLAAEGCGRLLGHLFDDYGVSVAVAEIDTRNAASIALVEGLGFRRVASVEGAGYLGGSFGDEYRYGLRGPGRSRC